MAARRSALAAFFVLLLCSQSVPSGQELPALRGETAIRPRYEPLAPGWYDWIYSQAARQRIPAATLGELEKLYRELDWLQRIRIPVALGMAEEIGLHMLGAAAGAVPGNAARLVRESATGTRQRENAATAAETKVEPPRNVLGAIIQREERINDVRRQFGMGSTIGPAARPIDVSSLWKNDDALRRFLADADAGEQLITRTDVDRDLPIGSLSVRESLTASGASRTQNVTGTDLDSIALLTHPSKVPKACAEDAEQLREQMAESACTREVLKVFADNSFVMKSCKEAQDEHIKLIGMMAKNLRGCVARHSKESPR